MRWSWEGVRWWLLVNFSRFLFSKEIQIAYLVQKIQRFCCRGGFFLLVELHPKGSASAACAVDRVRKHHLSWNNFYHPISCSIWSNISDFFLNFFFTFLSAPVNFLTVRDPPYGEKIKNISECFFDSSNWGFWDTERNAKNHSPLQSTVLEKIRKNCLKIVKNALFVKNGQFLAVFLDFFKNCAL